MSMRSITCKPYCFQESFEIISWIRCKLKLASFPALQSPALLLWVSMLASPHSTACRPLFWAFYAWAKPYIVAWDFPFRGVPCRGAFWGKKTFFPQTLTPFQHNGFFFKSAACPKNVFVFQTRVFKTHLCKTIFPKQYCFNNVFLFLPLISTSMVLLKVSSFKTLISGFNAPTVIVMSAINNNKKQQRE